VKPIQKVLVVDDDDDLLRLCKVSLRAYTEWSVDVARSAGEAVDLARRASPDVILLDVMMPDNEELAILRRIRAEHQAAAISFVLMTAMDACGLAALRGHGAAGIIAKPFDPCTLPDEIARIVGEGGAS
jgi:CheY-like chemotaxis protein